MTTDLAGLLERLLSLPTAPFHEHFVRSFLCDELKEGGIDFHLDGYGNIIASAEAAENSLACVAHMDHPGFEITAGGKNRVEADWFGGVEAKFFSAGRVVVYDRFSGIVCAHGVVEKVSKNPQGRVEKMILRVRGSASPGDFGAWNLPPFRRRGERIYTKGADDLVGCATILCALRALKERGMAGRLLGIFTRAEEQGFIGTLGMIHGGYIASTARIISVETSKSLPGAVLGGGPVIRLGDRTGMFHPQMTLFLDYVARETKRKDPEFLYQRRVMDGGTCEATPYQLNGHVTGGIAIPLFNYHNQGRGRIGPEAVHLRDVERSVRFLVEAAARVAEFHLPQKELLSRWEKGWLEHHHRLLPKPGGLK